MWPRPGASRFVRTWIVVTLVASIVAALDGGWLASVAALAPSRIWRGEVWRLVTWPVIESGPTSLALACLTMFKFGGELAARWGDRRLRRFVGEIVVGAAVFTCLLAAVAGATHVFRLGGWAVADALVIAWARQFPDATLVLYGLVELRGRQLIGFTLGIAVLGAIYLGPTAMAPELAACIVAVLYPKGWLHR